MSTTYLVYAEARVKDTWHALGPFLKDRDGQFKMRPLYWAQSAFYDTYLQLESYALSWGVPDDASEDLLAVFGDLDEDAGWCEGTTLRDLLNQSVFTVNFDVAVARNVNPSTRHKYAGYVFKPSIASFECGEMDSIEYWLTRSEYDELDPEEQSGYAWYEWDNWGDEYGILSEINSSVCMPRSWFADNVRPEDIGVSYEDFGYMQTRLIIEWA